MDSDSDRWKDSIECYLGTDPFDPCPDSLADDAWPPDIDKNRIVSAFDILAMAGSLNLGLTAADPGWVQRHDLDGNGVISGFDVLAMAPELNAGATC